MSETTRRSALGLLLGGAAGLHSWIANAAGVWPTEVKLGPARPFSFDQLKARAAALAGRPYQAPPAPPAKLLDAIDYDTFSKIAYRPGATLWGSAPGDGAVRFFPLSRDFRTPVEINVVAQGQARALKYDRSLFDAPPTSPITGLGLSGGLGGFKVMNPDHKTDWLAYLGASYFRSADPFNQFGLSARGIAIDTAMSSPEEFPIFTAFWLEHAPAGLIVHALLDGPSVTGAYRIAHHRAPEGLVQDIAVHLTFRRPVKRLGLAPLTSMYWYGRSDRTAGDDWRPQVHDSDGLSVWTGAGERIWRPLANPRRTLVNSFQDKTPRGFGLMQRDRGFEDYQDDGLFYERRPSVWVEPAGDWGAGAVQLVELPTTGENEDNIVAFWTPAATPAAGQTLTYGYRLHWAKEEPGAFGVARVVATRSGRGGLSSQAGPSDQRRFVVDFAGGALAGLDRQSRVEAKVDVTPGAPIGVAAYPVVGQDRWRLTFDIQGAAGQTLDLRAYLRKGGQALTETWIGQVAG